MTATEAERNILLYKWFRILREPLFWGPILISYIEHIGKMKLADQYFMESVVVALVIFAEVPSGALADLIGRKKSILLGNLLWLVGTVLFSAVSSPLEVWIANILFMLGGSFISGADEALIYDSLKEVGRESEYKKIEGEACGNQMLAWALCGIFAGFLSEIDPRLPLTLSIPGVFISCVLVFLMKEPGVRTAEYSCKKQIDIMKVSVLFVANHVKIKWVIAFATLLSVVSKLWFFTYNPYFELVGLEMKYYGVMFFFMNVIAWISSKQAHLISKWIPERWCVILMIIFIGIPLILMGFLVQLPMISMIFFQNIIRGFEIPFTSDLLNKHLDSENRATVISIRSAVRGIAHAIALSVFGWMLNVWSLPFCLTVLGVATIVAGIPIILKHKKIFG